MTKSNANKAGTSLSPALNPPQMIALGLIRLSSGFCFRNKIDLKAIDRYTAIIQKSLDDTAAGMEPVYPFNKPIYVFYDGEVYHVIDGWHRVTAAQKLGLKEIPCAVFDDHREAIRVGLESNQNHGVPLNEGDRAVRIKIAVAAFPELSNRSIADLVGCNSRYVDRIVNENQLRTGTQLVMGKDGKMRPPPKKRKESEIPLSDNTPVKSPKESSIPIDRIIGELKTALELPQADEEQRLEDLVNVVKTIFNDGFSNPIHRLDFKNLLEEAMPTWGL